MTVYRNFINGDWLESSSNKTAYNINPANTGDIIGTIKLSTRDEARKSVESAYHAFKDWKNTSAPARGKIVAKPARISKDNKEELAQILARKRENSWEA